jgi:tRNA A37 threonylcarbamoyladenosine synthetase subunit TsaC/SUA5/YrdC
VRDIDSLRKMADITDEQVEILEHYPYAWSVVLRKKESYILPEYMNHDDYTYISFRVAEYCIPAEFRDVIPYPLFLTSANLSGGPESETLQYAKIYFPDIEGYDG